MAVAVAGCGDDGGGGESGWQAEFQDSSRQLVNDPEFFPAAGLLQICAGLEMEEFGREAYELLLLEGLAEDAGDDDAPAWDGPGRPLDEILTDYGIEGTPAVLDEAVQIFLDEIERACP